MTKVLIHHGEIGLKGGNFPYFEKKLMSNIRKKLLENNIKTTEIKREEKRILLQTEEKPEKISQVLKLIFGIKNFSFITEVKNKIEEIEKTSEKIMNEMKKQNVKKMSFKTKRSDKNFPLNSIELNKKLGETSQNLGLKVDYSNPEKTIFIEITSKKTYIYTEKISGLGGLPVGTSGNVLCLLSGGIDSPVASWLMMKRGCRVDFLHFHTYKTNKEALKSKIKTLAMTLKKYQIKSRLYLVPYSTYEIMSQGKFDSKYDMIFFKHYLMKFSEFLAKEKKYDAIVTGDSLGQVASQTIENLKTSSFKIDKLIFRPLLTYDKEEIINLARKIGTYKTSIERYKDCCSTLAKNPSTKTKLENFEAMLEKTNLKEIISKNIKEMEAFDLN